MSGFAPARCKRNGSVMPDGHADAEGREYQPATGLAWPKTVPTESTGLYPVQSAGTFSFHIRTRHPYIV